MNVDVLIFVINAYPVTEVHYTVCDCDLVCMWPDSIRRASEGQRCSAVGINPRRTGSHLYREPVLTMAHVAEVIQLFFVVWSSVFSLQYFQCMKDHIQEQKCFHEVNYMFKRFAVLRTLLNKNVIVEYLSEQAWGF